MTNEQRRRRNARRNWPGAIVAAREPKPSLRAPAFTSERLEEMWRHCVRQWRASGREIANIPRSELPGEVFRIRPPGRDGDEN